MSQQNPLANPVLRYGIGISGAIVVGAVGYFFLEGTTQLLVYLIAVLDLLVTPQLLNRATTD